MILLIDNYDSFSYNLYQLIGEINPNIRVVKNNEMSVEEIEKLNPSKIIISPGPGRPEAAGNILEVIKKLYKKIPILGVCLGHQGICQSLGGEITYAKELNHGKTSKIYLEKDEIFNGLGTEIVVGRYHSLAVKKTTLPKELKIIGEAEDGEIMAVKHEEYPVYGLQFHPESILTKGGKRIIENFLNSTNM